jgi:hypothetical protein
MHRLITIEETRRLAEHNVRLMNDPINWPAECARRRAIALAIKLAKNAHHGWSAGR